MRRHPARSFGAGGVSFPTEPPHGRGGSWGKRPAVSRGKFSGGRRGAGTFEDLYEKPAGFHRRGLFLLLIYYSAGE